jgi:hypothetical protein
MMEEIDIPLLMRTIELILEEPDVPFLTHDGRETTTHAYAAFLQSVIDDQQPRKPPTAPA